jgi:hypothetical protein
VGEVLADQEWVTFGGEMVGASGGGSQYLEKRSKEAMK